MRLPDAVLATVRRYHERFPVPHGAPGAAIEEECRQWAIRLAEQVAFSHMFNGYGMKRADPGRPISKDTLAQMEGGRLLIWDLITGAGTGQGRFVGDVADSQDVTGQTFVPVEPVDHLNVGVPPPDEPDNPEPPPVPTVDIQALLDAIAALKAKVDALTFPDYVGSVWNPLTGRRTTLTLKPKDS